MMIIVQDLTFGDKLPFSSIAEFVEDFITDDYIEQQITNDFGYIEFPLDAGEIGYGTAIRKFCDLYDWRRIKREYCLAIEDEIQDNIDCSGTYEFEGLLIREGDEE